MFLCLCWVFTLVIENIEIGCFLHLRFSKKCDFLSPSITVFLEEEEIVGPTKSGKYKILQGINKPNIQHHADSL